METSKAPATAQAVTAPEEEPAAPIAEEKVSPSEIVQGFFDTLMANGDADVEAFLTQKSLATMEEGETSFHGERIERYTLGETLIDGNTARQDVTLSQEGVENDLSLLLRQQQNEWRIHGFSIPFEGGEDWVIDFESDNDPLEDVANSLATELAEGFEEAFAELADEFANGMEGWEANWSLDQAETQTSRFENLAVGQVQNLQSNWNGSVRGEGRPASVVLDEILDGTGFTFDHGQFAERLAQSSNLRLDGFSRIAALEALGSEIGLTPVYEEDFAMMNDAGTTLHWRDGVRTPAMSFAGPFGIYVRNLTENAPNPMGEIEVCARAIGVSPEILSANQRIFEVLTVTSAKGTGGPELLLDADRHWQTEPRVFASNLSVRQNYELGGLLRSIERIESIEGSVQIGAVNQLERLIVSSDQTSIALGTETAPVEWTSTSFSASFSSFPLDQFDANNIQSHLAAWNQDGAPLHLTSSYAQAWNGNLEIRADFEEKPARIGIALFSMDERSLPFVLPPHPLSQFEQQPASIASLEFEGQAPVSVEFRAFAANTNPDFPEADFQLKNHSNKAVLGMNAKFIYRDANGKELKDFPHTLQGDFDFDGHKPLTQPGETREHRTVAFFRPEETSSISVKVESIEFTDGTRWEPQQD